jgi:hypothetical protein
MVRAINDLPILRGSLSRMTKAALGGAVRQTAWKSLWRSMKNIRAISIAKPITSSYNNTMALQGLIQQEYFGCKSR